MKMTQKEGMERIKREFAFGGVEAALNELQDLTMYGFGMTSSAKEGLEAKAYKFIGAQIKKLAPNTIYTQPISGVIFTNNLSYAIEMGIRTSAIEYNWGSFTLVVDGEEYGWINMNHKGCVAFTKDWYLYPQDLLEA